MEVEDSLFAIILFSVGLVKLQNVQAASITKHTTIIYGNTSKVLSFRCL